MSDAVSALELDQIRLPVRAGVTPSARPTVRIFIGTEAAQYRADRVLVWSIEKVRDPAREYEITLLRDLPGFDRRKWTTSFTNFRFAIPHLLAGEGRAIYNDEDQIYLRDPAELFDLDLGPHGYRAVSASDTSVMLLDAERMLAVWPLRDCQRGSKRSLLKRAAGVPGLHGLLDAAWNVRDQEDRARDIRCLHYTTLHTQPWRPFPDRFVYDTHPDAGLWFDLEREANEAGFRLFHRAAPSRAFAASCQKAADASPADPSASALVDAVLRYGADDVLEVAGVGEKKPDDEPTRWGRVGLEDFLSNATGTPGADAVVCQDLLDALPRDDVPWVVDALFASARRIVFARVRGRLPTRSAGRRGPPSGTEGGPSWWRFVFESAARRRPGVAFEVEVQDDPRFPLAVSGFLWGGPRRESETPRVEVICDQEPSARASVQALAEALPWPYTWRAPDGSGELPDLLISAGAGAASVARAVRGQSRGRMLAVHLGAPGSDPARDFDLGVVSCSARKFPHPQRMSIVGPLVAPPKVVPAGEGGGVALLVGANDPRRAWTQGFASRLAEDVARFVAARGTSFEIGVMGTLEPGVEAALRAGLLEPGAFRVGLDGDALADIVAKASVLVVTGDDERLLATACASGRRVLLYPVPRRTGDLWLAAQDALRNFVWRRSRARPLNNRGTTRPQQWTELLASRCIERGWVDPVPESEIFHRRLLEEGTAGRFGEVETTKPSALRELERVAGRVRALLGA